MKYLWGESFTVPMGGDQKYRDNWDAIFAKPKTPDREGPCPCESGKVFAECHGKVDDQADE